MGTTGASINATICNMPLTQTVDGSVTLENPAAEMTVWMSGTTDLSGDVAVARQNSQVDVAFMKELNIFWETADITLDSEGNSFLLDMDLTFFNGMLQGQINDMIEPLLMVLVQQEMTAWLPFVPL